ncbi:hypothetical protein [Nonomuraea antimicrobica]
MSRSLGASVLAASHRSYSSTRSATSAGSPSRGSERAHSRMGRRLSGVG